ncbi:MAG: N-acetyltransferase [Thermoleophilia bacterium]|nr:N-acetyltransferase [Thermoleophilia bacterium]
MAAVRVRLERPDDKDDIRYVNVLAFDRTNEADTVDALRAAGAVTLSMVAVVDADEDEEGTVSGGEVTGHALVTPATVATDRGEMPLLGLGPVAVMPSHQGHGIGTMLVEACLERVRGEGHAGIVVAGRPEYYSRFGFIPAERWGLRWEGDVPEGVFMALELIAGRLGGVRGEVRLRPELTPI